MAETTLSPTPVDGGTLASLKYCDITHMGNDKWFGISYQTNPNHIIGTLWQVTGANTDSPSLTVLRNQILSDFAIGITSTLDFQVEKLNNDQVLVITNDNGAYTARVVDINTTTNVMTVVSTDTATWSALNRQTDRRKSRHSALQAADNEVLYAYGTNAQFGDMQGEVSQFSWDPATMSLSQQILCTTVSMNSYFGFSAMLKKSRDANTFWVFFEGDRGTSTAPDTEDRNWGAHAEGALNTTWPVVTPGAVLLQRGSSFLALNESTAYGFTENQLIYKCSASSTALNSLGNYHPITLTTDFQMESHWVGTDGVFISISHNVPALDDWHYEKMFNYNTYHFKVGKFSDTTTATASDPSLTDEGDITTTGSYPILAHKGKTVLKLSDTLLAIAGGTSIAASNDARFTLHFITPN